MCFINTIMYIKKEYYIKTIYEHKGNWEVICDELDILYEENK